MTGRVVAFTVTFFIPVMLVRIFDQAAFGTYKQAFLIYATLFGIAQLGMAESLFYFIPRAPEKAGQYVANSMLALAGAGLACLALVGAAAPALARWFKNPELGANIVLVGLFLLLMLCSAVLEIAMISRKRYLWASISYGLSDLVRALLFILPALALGSLRWLFLGGLAFAALRFGTTLLYVRREFGAELRPDAALLRQQLAYAVPFAMAVLVEIIQANYHYYAVSWRFDAVAFAIYSVGCLQIPLVDFVAGPAANVMMVRMSEEMHERRGDPVRGLWHDTTRKLALIFFPVFVLLLVSSREVIVFLFTENYLASVPVFMIWAFTVPFSVLQTDSVLRVFAQTRYLLVLYTVRLALTVGLLNAFVGAFYLQGAVLTTLVAVVVAKALALARIKRLMQVRFAQILPWRSLAAILGAALISGLPALLVRAELLHIQTLPLLLATAMAYGATYLLFLFGFRLLSEGERLALIGLLHRQPAVMAKPAG